MIALSPPQQSSSRLIHSTSVGNCLRRLQMGSYTLYHRWQSLQVSYRGTKYSVERLFALEEYIEHTSLVRVAIVVAGTLVPMVLLVLSQESLPLSDPRDGWRVNYGFWMRVGILAGVVSSTMAVQAKIIVRTATITSRQLILLFVCQSLSYPVVSMGIAALVGFPIPFFALSTLPIFFTMLIAWFTVIVGKKSVQEMLKRSEEMKTYVQFICVQMLMPAVYPIYEVIFYAASNTYYEIPVILLLPIIKVVMKYIATLALVRSEDMLPEAVIFTVEFFHAVYLATCMQSTRSTTTVAIIITVDVVQSVSMLYGLHRRSRTTLARAHRAAGTTRGNESLANLLRTMCSSSERIEKQNLGGIRVRSCLSHNLSRSSQDCLIRLENAQRERKGSRASSRSCLHGSSVRLTSFKLKQRQFVSRIGAKLFRWHGVTSVKPIVPSSIAVFSLSGDQFPDQRSSLQNSLAYRRSNIFRDGLEALFTSECLVLVCYLHASIAMFYTNFMVVMVYLPSAKYHTELKGITRENVADSVKSVFIFGILEFASFAALTGMLQRKYGMKVLYQLAFVLETQVALVQGKVMTWMLVILAFRVVHFGTCCGLAFTHAVNLCLHLPTFTDRIQRLP
ncbi:hypothetical protein PHYPSEUDO_003155 [Phytophthora pseudosyringae]|uniref:Uncharacterized protein n=1 Tax=Phytophthora pseudosyringae TaxID=221518 RepID=A0A8T1VSR2_9STRA|nr:hypothetical protein PHYPSEUDO_003155 [Phytophthora pseudosyringae]